MSQVPGASTPVVTGVQDAPDLRVAAEVELLHERVGLALDGARLAERWLPAGHLRWAIPMPFAIWAQMTVYVLCVRHLRDG